MGDTPLKAGAAANAARTKDSTEAAQKDKAAEASAEAAKQESSDDSDDEVVDVENYFYPRWTAEDGRALKALHEQLIQDFRPEGVLECQEVSDLAYLLYTIEFVSHDYRDHEDKILKYLYRLEQWKNIRRRLNPCSDARVFWERIKSSFAGVNDAPATARTNGEDEH